MLRNYTLAIFITLFPILISGQLIIIDDFETAASDGNYWQFISTEQADSLQSYVHVSYDSTNTYTCGKALQLDWSVHNCESWGGFSRLEHWLPGDSVFDVSEYDTLSIYYNITEASMPSGEAHLQLILYDVSDAFQGDTTMVDSLCEVYYAMCYILDQEPGWQVLKIPLSGPYTWENDGFVLTGWTGIQGNAILDQIKGFALGFAVSPDMSSEQISGSILFDDLAVYTMHVRRDYLFNGICYAGNVDFSYQGDSGQATITTELSYSGDRCLEWITSPDEINSGLVFTFEQPLNYNLHWSLNPLSFRIKAPTDMGSLRLVIADDDCDDTGSDCSFRAVFLLDSIAMQNAGYWKNIEVPLTNFDRYAGSDEDSGGIGAMDSSRLWQIQFLVADGNALDQRVYLDDIMLGPLPDHGNPQPPEFVVIPDTAHYCNHIYWTDNYNGVNETCTIYYCENLIDSVNLHSPEVEVLATNIAENSQQFKHNLRAPLDDQSVSYYYIVTCKDPTGNESELGESQFVTNRARGVAVVNYKSTFEFAADGTLTEYQALKPFRIFPDDGSGTVVDGTAISSEQDLSAKVWLVCDDHHLYIAFDITDDSVIVDQMADPWHNDSPDLYIGLYNWHDVPHIALQTGTEPDYHFNFGAEGVRLYPVNGSGDSIFIDNQHYDYIFQRKDSHGYCIEAKIAFGQLANLRGDSIYHPQVGYRIPLDFAINDRDSSTQREGLLTYSPLNQDFSWLDVSRWTHTWIYKPTSSAKQNEPVYLSEFKLYLKIPFRKVSCNFPNIFHRNRLGINISSAFL